MMPVRIISSGFNLLGEIDDYESLVFTRRYSKTGEFELHININKNNTDALKKDNIIIVGNNPHKCGIIRHREIKTNDDGSEELIIKGSSLSSIVGRRITIPLVGQAYDSIKAEAETVIKHYVNSNCVDPVDTKRKIQNLVIADDKKRGAVLSYQSRLKALDVEVETIAESAGLGFEVYLDIQNRQFVFEVTEGKNLTAAQSILPPVIFSVDFDNVTAQDFIDSDINYKNKGYVGGEGEGEDRNILEVGDDVSGLDRIEAFIDARDLNDDSNLKQRGLEKLNESSKIETFESQILQNSSFIYGKDYDLGDIVTIQNRKWGVTLESRITEITETYEADGFKLSATFGNNIPTLIDKIKQKFNEPLMESKVKISSLENDKNYDTENGAQEKANNAEENAKSYADDGDSSTLTKAKSYADSGDSSTLSNANKYTDSETNKVQGTLNTHVNDNTRHITADEPSYWNSKAEGTHKHTKGDITDFPTSLPASGGTADKAIVTHRLYRHENEGEDFYFISPYWTGNWNGWRIGAYNTNGDEQANIHRVSVDKADYADSAGNVPTKLSQLENDIGAGAGTTIITSSNEPSSHANGRVWVEIL
ncbi:siphovirus ReqiPepy6 Gp37-like family protein [Clostridium felsineum]|uniref:siphovirus ReqiPepy6 Gp37-like family protein n=1 Tax=Clostridium felsineum TaxID=36839 RepID=UPI00214D46AD|nr:siphovirus ReqiPepy6 Gp37-like family protein [Clostridium felsineum]